MTNTEEPKVKIEFIRRSLLPKHPRKKRVEMITCVSCGEVPQKDWRKHELCGLETGGPRR